MTQPRYNYSEPWRHNLNITTANLDNTTSIQLQQTLTTQPQYNYSKPLQHNLNTTTANPDNTPQYNYYRRWPWKTTVNLGSTVTECSMMVWIFGPINSSSFCLYGGQLESGPTRDSSVASLNTHTMLFLLIWRLPHIGLQALSLPFPLFFLSVPALTLSISN